MSSNQYRQMIGRAGRAGFSDTTGESILVFKGQDKEKVLELITGPMKRCESSFQGDNSKAIRILVLSLVALNLAHLGSQIFLFFKQTLFYLQQHTRIVKSMSIELVGAEDNVAFIPDEFELISSALVYLLENSLIKVNTSGNTVADWKSDAKSLFFANFEVTQLGLAAIKGNVDLDCIHQLYSDLKSGLKCLVLSNYLHLLYLCTPYELVNSLNNVDLDIYLNKVAFHKLSIKNLILHFFRSFVLFFVCLSSIII